MDYFEKYKRAKYCLYGMIIQFMDAYLKIEDLAKYNINNSNPNEYNPYIIGNYMEVCSHNFESEGLLAWDYLGINKTFITHNEIWNQKMNVKSEMIDESFNYEKLYYKISILIIDMVTKYYKYSLTVEEADKNNIKYDQKFDLDDNIVSTCFHQFESAGENAWNLFNIEDSIVGTSIFDNIRNDYCGKLIDMEYQKVKKMTK